MPGKKLIVIGGGAAGFFCAVNAAKMNPQLQVVLLEKSSKLLSKVKVSGGGRCNVTHSCFEISNLIKKYPRGGHFVKKAFHHFFTTDTVAWFEERGVKLKTEADGRMFPVTDNSQTIVDCLLRDASRYNVEVRLNADVRALKRNDDSWSIELATGKLEETDYICVASGGSPKISMFNWLTALGHTVSEPVPSLFTFNMPGNPITSLMGISVDNAEVKIAGSKLEQNGPLLITHWGMSGPAILKLSAWGARDLAACNWKFSIRVNWVPAWKEQQVREQFQTMRFENPTQKISNRNPFSLPQRLWDFMMEQSGIGPETRWTELPAKQQNLLISKLCAGEFEVNGKTTFKEEFVTAGGIQLNEVDASTMMSKKQPNLFFAGEILDVDGVTGGFNFQHAWTSGFIAAKEVARLSAGVS